MERMVYATLQFSHMTSNTIEEITCCSPFKDRHFHDGLGPQGQDNSKDPEEKDLYDDGLSTLTADEYVKIRLQPIITDFTRKTPGLSMFTNTVTIVVIALSVCSSVFSTFGLTAFIPLTLAFAGACTAWRSYKQADLRLMQANGALNQLHQVKQKYHQTSINFISVIHFIKFIVTLSRSWLFGGIV